MFDPKFDDGEVNVTVWIPGLPDWKPLYNNVLAWDCEQMRDGVKFLAPDIAKLIQCPFSLRKYSILSAENEVK